MKAILEFNMDDEDDRSLHKSMMQSRRLECAMFDFAQDVLRRNRKHGVTEELKQAVMNEAGPEADVESIILHTVEQLEQRFYSCLAEREASIDD